MEEKHSVWVGSLSSSAKEEILSDLFGKFGPVKSVVIVRDEQGKSKQFGYVNFFNREVAECAAHVMDGYVLLHQAIKTKGPKELQKLKTENVVVKQDYRMFTDCLFFIEGRDCTWITGECPFRHCQRAKDTESVCEKWLEQQCEHVECHYRHPRLTRNGSMVTDTSTNRCPSHNAFKCFGECGSKDCNTHFLEQQAYLDHVKMARKKLANPVGACAQCQAVFFSEPEQINHRCYKSVTIPSHSNPQHFTSTRVQAEKDIAQPIATYSNRILSKNVLDSGIGIPEYHRQNNHIQTSNTLSEQKFSNSKKNSCTLNNSLDRTNIYNDALLGNFQQQPPSISHGTHIETAISWRQTTCTTTNLHHRKEPEPIGVFWDFENCSVPKGKSALAVVQKLRSVFFKEKREVEFMCVCDISKEKKAVIEELNKAQVTVVHINATSKNAADDKLRQSLRRFAHTYSAPATVILISGDGNFTMDLSDLRHRHNFQIICFHHVAASSALLGFAHESHRFDLFAEDLPAYIPLQLPQLSTDVLITNLPLTKSSTLLKTRLTKLSDNCGGKVLTVSGTKAVIRFPNSEAAFRARRRLDKEELFGLILRATLLPLANNNKAILPGKQVQKDERDLRYDTCKPSTLLPAKTCVETNLTGCKGPLNTRPHEAAQYRNIIHKTFQKQNNPPRNGFTDFPRPPAYGHQFSFPGNIMYSNMFQRPVVPSLFHLRPGTTPPPLQNANPGVLAPPGSFSPVVNPAVRRSPSPEQLSAGVDLLVTNINESVSKKEIKRKLGSVFREHCKVYSVLLHARSGAPLRAFVKVPKLTDAHLAISKVTGNVILGNVVHVSIATDRDKELCYLQDDVVVVLQAVPLSWLPLATFLAKFEQHHRRCFDVRHLEQITEVVLINGSTGCQTLSLREGKVDTEPVKVEKDSFACDVFKLLYHYEGAIPLASLPALYWLEFHKEIPVCTSGKPLAELLSGLPNVTVAESGASSSAGRSIKWSKPTFIPCDASDLLLLSSQLVDILQKDHGFQMTINQLQERFFSVFNKLLDGFTYGFQSTSDLLHALSTVVEVEDTSSDTVVYLKRQHRVNLFAKEIEELLVEQPDHTLLLSNFMASYVKYFGQKFKVSSFGFNRLTDLIKSIPDVAEIDGAGDQRTVTLVQNKGEAYELQSRIDDLTQDFKTLLNGTKHKELSLSDVMEGYYRQHGHRFRLEDYGCETVEDVVSRLSNCFQVVIRGDEKLLQFCTNITADKMKNDLIHLLRTQNAKFVFVKSIPKIYEKLFERKFPFNTAQLKEALQSMTQDLKIYGNGNDKIIKLLNDSEAESDLEFLYAKTAVEILYEYPDHTLPKFKFLSLYRKKLLQTSKNVVENERILECVSCCVMVRQEGQEQLVFLKHEYCNQLLIERLKEVLSSSGEKSILLKDLPKRYEKHFRVKLNLRSRSLGEMKENLQGFIEITSSDVDHGNECLCLSPISRFEAETQALLKNYEGCISLNRFAPAYQQLFSKACVVSDFGYSKLASLLNAVPHVAKIIRTGPEKVVIAVERTIPERVCADLLSVRIINEDNGDGGSPRKVKEMVSCNNPAQKSLAPHRSLNDSSVEKEPLPKPSSMSSTVSSGSELDSSSNNSLTATPVVAYGNNSVNDIGRSNQNTYQKEKNMNSREELRCPSGSPYSSTSLPRTRVNYDISSQATQLKRNLPETTQHCVIPRHSTTPALQSGQLSEYSEPALWLSSLSSKTADSLKPGLRSTPQKVRLAANFAFTCNKS